MYVIFTKKGLYGEASEYPTARHQPLRLPPRKLVFAVGTSANKAGLGLHGGFRIIAGLKNATRNTPRLRILHFLF